MFVYLYVFSSRTYVQVVFFNQNPQKVHLTQIQNLVNSLVAVKIMSVCYKKKQMCSRSERKCDLINLFYILGK